VDNSVDNWVKNLLNPEETRPRVKLVIFSPIKKLLIFQ